MSAPRVYIVYPGHEFATVDVARGLRSGFRALGCEVEPYFLAARAAWFASLLQHEQRLAPEQLSEAAFAMAGEEIFGKLLRFDPDLVVIVNGEQIHPIVWAGLDRLRTRAGYPVHLVLTECPYEDETAVNLFGHVDTVWANDKLSAERWGCGYLAAAYDPEHHHPPAEPVGGVPDVLFIGTGWGERVRFFSEVDWSGIWLRIVGPDATWESAAGTPLEHCIEPGVMPGKALWMYYAGAGAIVNLHRRSLGLEGSEEVRGAWSLNPRCYQVPACGGLLLTDARPELAEVFGSVLPTFETPRELAALARFYLANPAARQDAIFASMEAVRPHTYTARAGQILEAA